MEITLPLLFMLEARRYQKIAHATKRLNLERVSYTNPTVDTRGEPCRKTFNFKRVSLLSFSQKQRSVAGRCVGMGIYWYQSRPTYQIWSPSSRNLGKCGESEIHGDEMRILEDTKCGL